MLNRINLLIMPTDICNMNCIYCFHSAHHENMGKMTLETLRQLYEITFTDYSDVTIIWHGGEPLIMGLDFYKEAINMQKEYSVSVKNRMQSNLTLLTDEIAEFLCENDIGIGASFDGCKNDDLRGHSQDILNSRSKMLARHKQCGFIMVVSKKNIDFLIESYEYFKSINANFTLNTYVSTESKIDNELKLNPKHTVKNIIELFDYWLLDTSCSIHIDYFERIITFVISGDKSVCKYNSCLGKWAGIRYNGDIVPCNRYFPKEYCFGNVWGYKGLSSAFTSKGFEKLLSKSIERRYKCKKCIAFPLCSGGCNNVALNENGIENNEGDSCTIFKPIYQYIVEKTIKVTKNLNNEMHYNPKVISIIKNSHNRKCSSFHYDSHYNNYVDTTR